MDIQPTLQDMLGLELENKEKSTDHNIMMYLPDCSSFLENNPAPKFPPNPLLFSQDALSQRPGMEWLQSVSCNLITPSTKDLSVQEEELNIFFEQLKKETMFLPADFSTALQIEGFKGANLLALDLETTGLDTRTLYDYEKKLNPKTKIVGVCLASSDTVGYYLPVMHTEEDGVLNWDYKTICNFLQKIADFFLLIYHNAQYDKEILALSGVNPKPFPQYFDTMILHFISDVNEKRHGLKAVSEQMLGRKMIEISQLFSETGEKVKGHINFDRLACQNAVVYGCSDAINTMGLFLQFAQMPKEKNVFIQQPIPIMIDHKLVDVLRSLYRPGFPINIDFAIKSCKDIVYRLKMLQKKAYEFLGREFDIQSPQQISKILFEELKIPPMKGMVKGKPTKSNPEGLYSTAADVLEDLFQKYPEIPILEYIVTYRQLALAINNVLSKLIANSYVDGFLPYTRCRASYSTTVIPTGRLSSASSSGREGIRASLTAKGNLSYKYEKGDWGSGINTQGISKPDKKQAKANKIISLPEEAGLNLKQTYSEEIEKEFVKLLAAV
jgi:DNA polymerase-1